MSRPIYQTSDDVKNEKDVAGIVSRLFRCVVVRNKNLFPADYSFIRDGRVVAIGECKRRKNDSGKYPTLFLSLHKFDAIRNMARSSGLPAFLIVQWDDALGWVDLSAFDPKAGYVTIGGRADRGDSQDIEPLMNFPLSAFSFMS